MTMKGCANLYEGRVYNSIKKCLQVLNKNRSWKTQIGYIAEKPWEFITSRYDDRDYLTIPELLSPKLKRKINTKAEEFDNWIERWPIVFSFDRDYIREIHRWKVESQV